MSAITGIIALSLQYSVYGEFVIANDYFKLQISMNAMSTMEVVTKTALTLGVGSSAPV